MKRQPPGAASRIVGSADAGGIEARFDPTPPVPDRLLPDRRSLDEVVARNAFVHLERMGDGEFALIVETRCERACFYISSSSGKAAVAAGESWREPRPRSVKN